MTREEMLAWIQDEFDAAMEILRAKNTDYAGGGDDAFSNFRACASLGLCTAEQGVLVRLSDKLARLASLTQPGAKAAVADETFLDTCRDLANYAMILGALHGDSSESDMPTARLSDGESGACHSCGRITPLADLEDGDGDCRACLAADEYDGLSPAEIMQRADDHIRRLVAAGFCSAEQARDSASDEYDAVLAAMMLLRARQRHPINGPELCAECGESFAHGVCATCQKPLCAVCCQPDIGAFHWYCRDHYPGPVDRSRNVYLAARYGRRAELSGYAGQLREAGYTVTSRWLDTAEEGAPDFLTIRSWAEQDIEDLDAAETVVCFSEALNETDSEYSRGGRHVELGYALARDKRVFVVGPVENVFMALGQVHHADRWEEVLYVLNQLEPHLGEQ